MIRPAVPDDVPVLTDVVVRSGLFGREDSALLVELFQSFFDDGRARGHGLVVDVDRPGAGRGDEHAVGVAYWQPVAVTDRTWDLTMIAVEASSQGLGRGRALMRFVEQALRDAGQRLVIVQTSGVDAFTGVRTFYARLGYEEEARVRSYWAAGDDLVTFRLVL